MLKQLAYITILFFCCSLLKAEPKEAKPLVASMQVNGKDPRDSFEVGSYWYDGKKWQLRVRLGVWGASDFSKVTEKEYTALRKWQRELQEPNLAEKKFYQVKTGDFEKIPEVAQMIRRQLEGIEKMYNTDFLETKFDVFFLDTNNRKAKALLDERELVDAQAFLNPKFRKVFSEEPFLPVKYNALPNPYVVTPGSWDPYTYPEFNAHELFHLLSRDHFNDGFGIKNYPLDGIMNGGKDFSKLRELGYSPKVHKVEFNTLLLNQEKFALGKTRRIQKYKPNYYSMDKSWIPFEHLPETNAKEAQAFETEFKEKVNAFLALPESEKRPFGTESFCAKKVLRKLSQ